MTKLTILITIIVCVIITSGCETDNFTQKTRSIPNKPIRYFKGFAHYGLPIRPVGEMSAAEVNEISVHYSYRKALYDSTGKLVSLHEIFKGRIVSQVNYFYDPNDILIMCELSRPSETGAIRKVTEQYFDKQGKLTITKVKTFDNQGLLIEEMVVK